MHNKKTHSAPNLHYSAQQCSRYFFLTVTSLLIAGSIVALTRLLLSTVYGINVYDEGLVNYNAQRIIEGDIPYRDFWSMYAPGQFYWLAGLFKLFGSSLTIAKLNGLIFKIATVLVLGIVSWQLTHSRYLTFISVSMMLITQNILHNLASPVIMAVFFCGLCTCILLNAKPSNEIILGITAGILLLIATVFRHDIGGYAAVGHCLGLLISNRAKPLISLIVIYSAGTSTIIYVLGMNAGWDNIWQQLIAFPATDFPAQRNLPWPRPLPKYWGIYLPIVVAGTLALNGRQLFNEAKIFLIPACVMLLMLGQLTVRTEYEHVYPALLYALALLAFVFKHSKPSSKILIVSLYLICSVTAMRRVNDDWKNMSEWLSRKSCTELNIERAGNTRICDQHLGLAETLQYIDKHSKESSNIFVGNAPHDKAYVNDVMFYFLSNRRSATRYHELHPGISTTLAVQLEILDSWKHKAPDYIVLHNFVSTEQNNSSLSSGVRVLDDYIDNQFISETQFGEYVILRRKAPEHSN